MTASVAFVVAPFRSGSTAVWSACRLIKGIFRGLAAVHRRFKMKAASLVPHVVAAGRGDAQVPDAVWEPNLDERSAKPRRYESKPFDVVFFGSLGYAPSVEGLRWLAQADTPAARISVLVAGHGPTQEVGALCQTNGWVLHEDYPSNEWLTEQAKVTLAPPQSTAGIQTKVLEAASRGLAQVVAPAALADVGDSFPSMVADTPAELVAAVKQLTSDAGARRQLADDAWAFAHANYTTDGWVPTLWNILVDPGDLRPPFVGEMADTVVGAPSAVAGKG
ncbi:MAG: glycosyltransferase [Actinobacteria bacterium]|nr:glycosyltransferase [Actinomycetota bacterium]